MNQSIFLSNDVTGDKSQDPFQGIWSAIPFPLLVIIIIMVVILKSVRVHSPS